MTNPGHLDPGYHGKLRFTVINMGRESYSLDRGAPIVTLLFFELTDKSKCDWPSRGNSSSGIAQESIDRLSRDFVDVTRRAKEISDSTVKKSIGFATAIATAFAALVTVAVPSVVSLFLTSPEKSTWGRAIEAQVSVLKESCNVQRTQQRVESLEATVLAITAATCKQSPPPAYCTSNSNLNLPPKQPKP
jgi:hypothetical protein